MQFCERVQLDSFVFNELGNPDDLLSDGNATEDDINNLSRYLGNTKCFLKHGIYGGVQYVTPVLPSVERSKKLLLFIHFFSFPGFSHDL